MNDDKFLRLENILLTEGERGPDKVAYELYGSNGAVIKTPEKVAFGYWVGNNVSRVFVPRGFQINMEHKEDKYPGISLASWQDALKNTLNTNAQDTK